MIINIGMMGFVILMLLKIIFKYILNYLEVVKIYFSFSGSR
ncbi:hypothetical protein ADICYQ_1732 [Cyclobacterium qasimii M12-11B]|uniref:Uncharacterized protein n=1 Tax=Cyclobacterium qasimii M12-11B TaxID=641524 RepID=S7VIA1_9BACT|nr:hypothetical protein ADICYQ_1732 [Cyclobacterium qasimii M12-11B]